MKNLLILTYLLLSLQVFGQFNLDSAFVDSRWDSLDCQHFLKAHKVLKTEGLSNYSKYVDYNILDYIEKRSTCNKLEEHRIHIGQLKYFLWMILYFKEND